MKTENRINQEIEKIKEEIERAEADGNSLLPHLEGWGLALRWVLEEEGE